MLKFDNALLKKLSKSVNVETAGCVSRLFPYNSRWLVFKEVNINLKTRGIASFSISCRPGWLSFPHILRIARITSTHWLHQHFELWSFLTHPKNAQFITNKRVIKPKICRPWVGYTLDYVDTSLAKKTPSTLPDRVWLNLCSMVDMVKFLWPETIVFSSKWYRKAHLLKKETFWPFQWSTLFHVITNPFF